MPVYRRNRKVKVLSERAQFLVDISKIIKETTKIASSFGNQMNCSTKEDAPLNQPRNGFSRSG